MLDDQRQFERTYPQARTLRDGVPYPIRVHRVAAARRAHELTGGRSRIANRRQRGLIHRAGVRSNDAVLLGEM